MSVYQVVVCDGCDKWAPVAGLTKYWARKHMSNDGFTGRAGWLLAAPGGKDYCPRCRKRVKAVGS